MWKQQYFWTPVKYNSYYFGEEMLQEDWKYEKRKSIYEKYLHFK